MTKYRITLCQSLRWLKLADMMYRKIQINFNFWSSVDIRLYWNVLNIFASHANQDFDMEWFIYISCYPHVLSIFTYNKWNTTTSTQIRLPKLKVDRLQVNMGLPNNLNLWEIGRKIYYLNPHCHRFIWIYADLSMIEYNLNRSTMAAEQIDNLWTQVLRFVFYIIYLLS